MGPKRTNKTVLPPITPALDINSNCFFPDRDLSKLSDESRLIVEIIMDKFDAFSRDICMKIEAKNEKIAHLEQEVVTLKKQNDDLCDRLDSIESRERSDCVVVSGSSLPPGRKDENTLNIVSSLIANNLKVKLSEHDILSAYRLGRKTLSQQADLRRIVVRFSSIGVKRDLISSCRTVKPPGLYFNDYLTPTRSEILFTLRQAKRKHPYVIAAVGSQNNSVFAFLKSHNVNDKNFKVFINSKVKLGEFCEKSLGTTLEEVVVGNIHTV